MNTRIDIAVLLGLIVLIGLLSFCRERYPEQTSKMFHIPPELDGITATEWMLFRIALLLAFAWALYSVVALHLK